MSGQSGDSGRTDGRKEAADGASEPRDDAASASSDDAPEWRRTLASEGELTPDVVAAILDAHGDRGSRAIEAVGEGRVKEYQDFPVVVGHSDEYVVENGACTCKDAAYNLDPADPEALCWHALAVEIARAVDEVDRHDMYYSEVRDLL